MSDQKLKQETLARIFKNYDIRGLYPQELNEDLAYEIGRVLVPLIQARHIVIGRDMREGAAELSDALAEGCMDAGADVIDIGLVSTDALYFAVGRYAYDGGVMITASHNPAGFCGMKITEKDARAVSFASGLGKIMEQVKTGSLPEKAASKGKSSARELLEEFGQHCLSFIEPTLIKPLKIAIDAGNGMAGKTVPALFKYLPCEILPIYFELDGSFPNHPASPLEPENLQDLQKAVLDNGCDLGVAFDGDADRMFIVDENASIVGGDIVTALVALNTLKHYPGARILYNLICSRSVPELIEACGGQPRRSPVGHSLIKQIMRDEDIAFGGEHSGHFYFKNNWYADSGMIALLQCLEMISNQGKRVSELIEPLDRRFRSGEINSRVNDIPAKIEMFKGQYKDGHVDRLDGLTIEYDDWWLNLRASNTEPLLRLNLEADSMELMQKELERALTFIRG